MELEYKAAKKAFKDKMVAKILGGEVDGREGTAGLAPSAARDLSVAWFFIAAGGIVSEKAMLCVHGYMF